MTARSSFSHKVMKEEAIRIKVQRAITQVQGDNPNGDIAIKHPEWVREAQNNKYTELTKSITESMKRFQESAQARRDKVARKD